MGPSTDARPKTDDGGDQFGMTEQQEDRLQAHKRLYEAGRIDANAYISAGGDPAVVDTVEMVRHSANGPSNRSTGASPDASSHPSARWRPRLGPGPSGDADLKAWR